jgi:uncharacterized repeat protein (TIGR03803 family)
MLLKRKFRITGLGALAAAALGLAALGAGPARAAATLTKLADFDGADGAAPAAGLIADASGNLFGTTEVGGAHQAGTVFEIAKTATGYARRPAVLVSFCGQPDCPDGAEPEAGLLADAAGDLFGTTYYGGATGGLGTVFEIAKTASGYAGRPTLRYSFCSQPYCTDGLNPVAGLVADGLGNLFGTTAGGGPFSFGFGTAFEIAKTATGYASAPTVLYNFCAQPNCTDGAQPVAGLLADAAGNLFGTTYLGGAKNAGTVFEIAKTATGYASAPTVLVSFCAQPNCTDGRFPEAGLIADAAGNLFGTTARGGATGDGMVFKVAKTATGYASAPTVLVSFLGREAKFPVAGLIADAAGNLFGTTREGGPKNDGTVFELRGSGFVPPRTLVPPGTPNCRSNSLSALVGNYGGLGAAAVALGYSSVQVLQNAITTYCAGRGQ